MGSLRVGYDWASSLSLSLSCIWEGNGAPLQCSCLENPRDGGAWWAAVSGVAQSRTWLKRLRSSSSKGQSEPLIWGIWPWNPVLDQGRGRYAWYTCELRKAANREEKWVRPAEGSRDPALSDRTAMTPGRLSSSTQPPDHPGSRTAVPASGLCETNSPVCLSQLEQTEQMVPNEDKCKVIAIPHLLPLCVCVLSEGLFKFTPKASLFTRWTWRDVFLQSSAVLRTSNVSHRLWVPRSQRSFALSQTPPTTKMAPL